MKILTCCLILLTTFSAQAFTTFFCEDVDGVASAKTYEFVVADKLTFRFLTFLEIDDDVIYRNAFGGRYLPPESILIDEFSVSGNSVGILLEHEGQELQLVCKAN